MDPSSDVQNIKNEDFASIDLDKELLGTKSTKFKQKDGIKIPNSQFNQEMYLSPGQKENYVLRKITGATDNTKADSIVKMSERSNKNINTKLNGFDLESFPSGNMFLTKSEEQDEVTLSRDKIKANVHIDELISTP